MMRDQLRNQVCNIKSGTAILGKWHSHKYYIVRKLGEGATGVVYLAQNENDEQVALKISFANMSVTAEVNVLKQLSKVHGKVLGPSLLDVDDWAVKQGTVMLSFYVMEYLKGEGFLPFISRKGEEWLSVLVLQLLGDLEGLHQAGWTFGDLKPDNLIVTTNPFRLRLLDVGGTTQHGRAIKEFTEFFDRGYWGLGSRKADGPYDLFAVAMIFINGAYPKQFSKQEQPLKQLERCIDEKKILRPYKKPLMKALKGEYSAASHMKNDILNVVKGGDKKPQSSSSANNTTYATTGRRRRVKRKKKRTAETFFLLISVAIAYFVYFFIQVW